MEALRIMSPAEFQYYAVLAQVFERRARGEDDSDLLDRLDGIGRSLDERAVGRINVVSAQIAREQISEPQFSEWVRIQMHCFYSTNAVSGVSEPPVRIVDRASTTARAFANA